METKKWVYNNADILPFEGDIQDVDIQAYIHARGIITKEDRRIFYRGNTKDLGDPYTFADMDIAIERIKKAIDNNEHICIYGDYDVDGVTSTSLMYMVLRELGANVDFYIPLRDEGYGLNIEALRTIKDAGAHLVITVDCGITSIAEVAFCDEIGLDIIITDHHDIGENIPNALAVINPKRPENTHPCKYLAGVGTAFMTCLALFTSYDRPNDTFKYLDIVAVGTIADIVPLMSTNRIIVREGLKRLAKSQSLGFRMLLGMLFPDWQEHEFNTTDIGFKIAPIFNAAGRMEDAKKGVMLFTSTDRDECVSLVESMIDQNNKRRELQESITTTAIDIIEGEGLVGDKIIVVGSRDFHHGVIGIVAAKIMDKYTHPVIIYEEKEMDINGIMTTVMVASCRSIPGFDISECLSHFKDYFIKFGGHPLAAGFTIEAAKMPEFRRQLLAYVNENIDESSLVETIKIEADIPIWKINEDFYKRVEALGPFGQDHKAPIFSITGCTLDNVRIIGKDKSHLMVSIVRDNFVIRNCVWFKKASYKQELDALITDGATFDIAGEITSDIFRGKRNTKILIKDIRVSTTPLTRFLEYKRAYETYFPITTSYVISTKSDMRPELGKMYIQREKLIQKRKVVGFLDDNVSLLLERIASWFGFKLYAICKEIKVTDDGLAVKVIILRETEFTTYATNVKDLFIDIKNYLIGKTFPYNNMQKAALKSFFHDNENTIVDNSSHRGAKTVRRTVELYCHIMKKRLESTPDSITLDGITMRFEPHPTDDNEFIKNIFADNVVLIEDVASLSEIVKKIENPDKIFTKFLPITRKLEILKARQNGEKCLATRDILPYL